MAEIGLYFLLIALLLVMCSVLVLSVVAIYFFISSGFMRYPPPIPSSGRLKEKVLADICTFLESRKNMVLMDLGSGWGTLLVPLAKRFPQHRFIGIERAFLPYIISTLRAYNLPNLKFERGDIFTTDISQADVVYCFLMQKIMNRLEPRLQKELKSGACVYSCRFPCPNWPPQQTVSFGNKFNTYFIYRKD